MAFALLCALPTLRIPVLGSTEALAFVPRWIADPETELHPEQSEDLRRWEETLARSARAKTDGGLGLQDDYDVLRYRIALYPDFASEHLHGLVTIALASLVDDLSVVELDLYDDLTVTGVTSANETLDFTHAQDKLRISLPKPLGLQATTSINVVYEGTPQPAGFMGFDFRRTPAGAPVLATLSQPSYARSWWPCKDVPSDKALVSLSVIAPSNMFAASNGELVAQRETGDYVEYTWNESYPISTYNVSLAIAEYSSWTEPYVTPGGRQMTLEYHVFPEHRAAAEIDFERTAQILDLYVTLFGEYPFVEDKYGMAEFVWEGAMEHQTMTSYGDFFLTGDKFYERIVGHELAHQWFGNAMTVRDWNEIWLHEGFATYAEALWIEHVEGVDEYRSFMRRRSNRCCGFSGPLLPPDRLFNQTVYFKGAWVLHMLRDLVGDNDFFQGMRDVASLRQAQYGTISSTDLVSQFEQSTGQNLQWFFDQWLLRPGRPTLDLTWTAEPLGDSYRLRVTIEQTQEDDPWIVPVDLRFTTGAGTQDLQVWMSSRRQEVTVTVDAVPLDVELDPDEWLLHFSADDDGVTAAPSVGRTSLRLLPNVPNPFNPRTLLRFELPSPSDVRLRILDAQGRMVDVIDAGPLQPGLHETQWGGTDRSGRPVASGVYHVLIEDASGYGSSRKITLVR